MRHFTIIPTKAGNPLSEIYALDERGALHTVSSLDCDEAAVFEGEIYRYSLGLDAAGSWTRFWRQEPMPSRPA